MKAIDFHSVDAMLNLIFLQFVIGDTPLLNETYIRMFMSINEVENLFYEKKNSFKTNFKAENVGNFLNTHGQHLIIIIANHGQNVRSSMHCRSMLHADCESCMACDLLHWNWANRLFTRGLSLTFRDSSQTTRHKVSTLCRNLSCLFSLNNCSNYIINVYKQYILSDFDTIELGIILLLVDTWRNTIPYNTVILKHV